MTDRKYLDKFAKTTYSQIRSELFNGHTKSKNNSYVTASQETFDSLIKELHDGLYKLDDEDNTYFFIQYNGKKLSVPHNLKSQYRRTCIIS